MTLTHDDLTMIEGEARVSCRQLAEALGFSRRDPFVRLVKSKLDELEDFGEVFHFEVENPSAQGGRPLKTYYLNEHQAVALCMWAQTERARVARMQIVDVFVAWRRGDLTERDAAVPAQPVSAAPDMNAIMAASAERVRHSTELLRSLQGMGGLGGIAMDLTHLPIWPSNRRPQWWHDQEVRDFLTRSHRQMSSVMAEQEGQRLFGDRCPKKSSICAYWLRLDKAKQDALSGGVPGAPVSVPQLRG